MSVASTGVKAGTTYRLVLHSQSDGALLGSIPLTTHYTLLVLSLKTDDGEKQGQKHRGQVTSYCHAAQIFAARSHCPNEATEPDTPSTMRL
jgi:hypothetical protein